MRKVSIIIPVMRPESAERCGKAIYAQESGVDFLGDNIQVLAVKDTDDIGCPAMIKKLTAMSRHDLVMFLGDDTIPQPGFLVAALKAMESLPDGWGVVGLNTTPGGNDHAHWLADKRILEHLPGGDFFCTDYTHNFCDDELKDIAVELGRWAFAEDSDIEHDHPMFTDDDMDEGHQKATAPETFMQDKKTYVRRKIERTRDRVGTRLALAYPVTYEILYAPFSFSNLFMVINFLVESIRKSGQSIDIDILMPELPGNHDVVRNNLAGQSLRLGCTDILMLDTDQVFYDPDTIQKLLDHKKSVVGAIVHRRYPPFDPILVEEINGKTVLMDHDKIEKTMDDGQLIEVPYTGCGCILYDTRVFLDVDPPWFQLGKTDDGRPRGEDFHFCEQLRRSGHKIFVDASIKITHLSLEEIGMDQYRLFHKLQSVKEEVGKNGK